MFNLPLGRVALIAFVVALSVAAPGMAADNPAPAVSVGMLEKISTFPGSYLPGPIFGALGQTVAYEIVVANTGSVQATVSLDDPGCTSLLAQGGTTLDPGQWVAYTCSHELADGDAGLYTNAVTATAAGSDGQTVTTAPVATVTSVAPLSEVLGTTTVIVKKHAKAKHKKVCHVSG